MIFGLQAIVLIVLLFLKRPIRQSNVFLALLLLFFALMSVNIAWLNFLITYDKLKITGYAQLELIYGIGPSLFLFSKCITDPDYRISRKEFMHFVPVILEFIYYRTGFYRVGLYDRLETYETGVLDIYHASKYHPYTIFYLVLQWTGTASILVYMFLSVRVLVRYKQWIKSKYSNLKNKSLGWLCIPVIIYSTYYVVWIILRYIDVFVFESSFKDIYFLPSFIGVSIFTCWIGFKGYIKSQTEAVGFSKANNKQAPSTTNPEEAQKIISLMATDKPYLNSDLDLPKLSKLLKIPPKKTSHIINHDLETNFYEFVNKYRIEEFKRRVQKENRDQFTLLAHAYESGFSSKSTFNHVFKKFTGQTPREYYFQVKN